MIGNRAANRKKAEANLDIVIEGKITPDEGLAEILQTVVDLKNVPNAVLRVTSAQGDLQGRIGFAQGGYILGGKINATEETGYPALRKLCQIKTGTYAILDPGRTQMSDVNQTLWIKAASVIGMLPELPESPESLLDGGNLGSINTTVDKAQLDPMDLKVAKHATGDLVGTKGSKARQHDAAAVRNMRLFLVLFVALLVAAGIAEYWDSIVGMLHLQ
jgi:hypothetical protein